VANNLEWMHGLFIILEHSVLQRFLFRCLSKSLDQTSIGSHVLHIQPILWNSIGDISNSFGYSVQTVAIQFPVCGQLRQGQAVAQKQGSEAMFGCMEFWQTSRELGLLLRFCCVCTDWQQVLAFGPYPCKPDPLSCTALHEMDLSCSYMCIFFIFLWGSCVELLISWYFFPIRQKLLLIDIHDYFFFVINYHMYSYAPSLLHAVIEAKASRSSFWCLSSPVNNRRTAIIQNTIHKQRMYRDNDKMQLAGKQLNCVFCPNAC